MKRILVSPVDYFGVFYKINPWMDPKNAVDGERAEKQWKNLIQTYKDFGLQVEEIPAVNGLPDMVFTANGFFSIDKKAVVARFRFPQRQGETDYFIDWLKKHNFDITDPGKIVYEGQGDTLLAGKKILQGWGFRSDKEIAKLMEKTYPGYQVIPLHLINDRFYHLDTCLLPVRNDLVFYYDGAFDGESIKLIKKTFKHAISVGEDEAMTFALNSVVTDHTVIMNKNGRKVADRLKAEGFNVLQLPMHEFLKSGGAVKCLTNEIFLTN